MDKYTVDLDQVLNDFEYSELTDQQHSKNVAERVQSNVPFQPPPITKHSINNVFHSLNEYLNSGINNAKGGASYVPDNNVQTEDDVNINFDRNNSIANGGKPNTLEHAEYSGEIVDSNKTEPSSILLPDTGQPEALIPELSCIGNDESNNVHNDLECDSVILDKADSALGKGEANFGVEEQISVEIIDDSDDAHNSIPILVNIKEDDVQKQEDTSKLESFVIEVSESPYAVGEANKEINEALEQSKNDLSEQPTEEATETPHDDNSAADLNQSCLVPENLKSIGPNNEANKNEVFPTIVGFSTDIDIDEGELHKMLEDLELEENDSGSGEHTPEDLVGDFESALEEQEGENNKINIEEDDNKVVPEAEDMGEVTFEPQIDVNTTRSVPNDVIEANAREEEKAIPSQIECLELEKPSKPKKSSKKPIQPVQSGESTTTVQYTQEVLEEQSERIEREVKNEELTLEKDPVSRPQDLPLNNELKDENIGRKINLIGSPGSTPYNNVYINKSIDTESSDYTSSASPTFSDCSTESTSTASTVSVENVLNNADKFTKKTGGVKNTNVEGAEIKDSGEQRDVEVTVGQDSVGIPDEETAVVDELENSATDLEIGAGDSQVQSSQSSDTFLDTSRLGKEAPLWIPDADASSCLHCDMKFTVLKRRHHCRACGLVLCSKCCNLKFKLDYMEAEARVCNKCYGILNKDTPNNASSNQDSPELNSSSFRPNPNNPLEYCSMVSPLQQAGQAGANPPSVMVPVGVLKRKGSNKKSNKSVMFCDGIAPGSDLTILDQDFNYNSDSNAHKSLQKTPDEPKKKEEPVPPPLTVVPTAKVSRNQPKIDQETGCFIPKSETSLPPTVSINKTDILYSDCSNSPSVVEMLKNEALLFAINQNLFVHVKVINMNCCINKQAWCFCSEGLINVGSDEVVYLIEYIEEESFVPKDVFFHIHNVYTDALRGTSIKELGLSLHNTSNFLDSRNHAGFVYIKPTFQCLENVIVPKEPYLIGLLIHRWETPWAKLFPLRLILRLGAEYRYYPSPLISTRHRDSVFVEIGHTIINLLADFRNFTYTLPQIRGLIIHMEDKKTTITIPKNRYDQVMKSINNSSEHTLAFAGNFSPEADSHLVCIQDTQGHENCYTTHAINIHNKPRNVTGASFIVFNGSLKSSTGLTAKSNIVEDGLMIQIPSEHLERIRDNLRNMKDHTIACGCINATSDETVNILWGDNDADFNVGVKSPVDLTDMKGIPSIRVHNGKDHFCNNGTRLIRWTEVFILQNGEDNPKNQEPLDISKISESVAKASCTALVKYLDLLVSNSCQKIGIRTTLHVENVSYSAGSNGLKLPPIYMRSLDNELVPVLHRITSNNLGGDSAIVLELIFRILNS